MTDSSFQDELEALINKHSVEQASNTPDFILAHFLNSCLDAFNHSVVVRDTWHGHDSKIRYTPSD